MPWIGGTSRLRTISQSGWRSSWRLGHANCHGELRATSVLGAHIEAQGPVVPTPRTFPENEPTGPRSWGRGAALAGRKKA